MRAALAMLASMPQFLRFAVVGALGFFVDASALYAALYLLGAGPYVGRLISYFCAATFTWYLNRHITFRTSRSQDRGGEWLRFVVCNSLGGALNYATYAAYVHLAGLSPAAPIIGVALGSCAGLVVNFLLSRRFVFAAAKPASRLEAGDAHIEP